MAQSSSIEWCDATWNPVAGCTKIATGCANCYAIRQVHRMAGNPNPKIRAANEGLTYVLANGKLDWTGEMRMLPDRLTQPLRTKKPTRWFVNSLSDLFHPDVPFKYIAACFGIMAACPRHTFQILTKRPERAVEFFAWIARQVAVGLEAAGPLHPLAVATGSANQIAGFDTLPVPPTPFGEWPWPLPNVWIGASIASNGDVDANIYHLLRITAAVLFVSAEPLVAPVQFPPEALGGYPESDEWARTGPKRPRLDWVIVGGESGPGARPCNIGWIRSIVEQCKASDVPVFVKQLGARPVGCWGDWTELQPPLDTLDGGRFRLRDRKGGDIQEFPVDLRVREFPEVTP